uniref:SJCHGC08335 protein n=1 Tax=Schistosoma japonicum TaxID=6182 RepID=Q5DEK5_SCHJA|nr:SJCHGC08335 protein [Schistosoma japonicum]
MIRDYSVNLNTFNYFILLTFIVCIISPTLFGEQGVNWDITYLLNRRYDIARADEDFPIKIQPPPGDLLYSVPALRLFPQSKLPDETFFIHLIFKPNKTAIQHGLYLFSIRDPDNVLRLSLKLLNTLPIR